MSKIKIVIFVCAVYICLPTYGMKKSYNPFKLEKLNQSEMTSDYSNPEISPRSLQNLATKCYFKMGNRGEGYSLVANIAIETNDFEQTFDGKTTLEKIINKIVEKKVGRKNAILSKQGDYSNINHILKKPLKLLYKNPISVASTWSNLHFPKKNDDDIFL